MINRLYTTMKTNVGNNIQDTSSNTATIIGKYLNDAYFDLLRRKNWELIDWDYSFSTVAGTQDYVMPANFGKELYVHDATNKKQLSRLSPQQHVDANEKTLTEQDAPVSYLILTKRSKAQPASAEKIDVVSSSASDTTQSVQIRGISSGVEMSESITLTGTVAASSTNTYTEIISISKDAATTGKITVDGNTSSTEYAVMAPEDLEYRVTALRLYKTPAAVYTINVPYHIKPLPMSNDDDILLIDAADVVEAGATALAWRYKRQFAKAQEWERTFEKQIQTLMWDEENQPNQVKLFNPQAYSRDTV